MNEVTVNPGKDSDTRLGISHLPLGLSFPYMGHFWRGEKEENAQLY